MKKESRAALHRNEKICEWFCWWLGERVINWSTKVNVLGNQNECANFSPYRKQRLLVGSALKLFRSILALPYVVLSDMKFYD